MATLPTVGGDYNTHGDELTEWLLVAHNADGTAKTSSYLDDTWDDVRNYADLATAVSTIGSMQTDLLIPNGQTVSGDLTIPETMRLWIVSTGQITINTGITLTINSPGHIVTGGRNQIFTLSGTGAVVFTRRGAVYPEWWGAKPDGSTDCTTEINDAIQSLTTAGGVVCIQPGTYLISSVVTMESNVSVIGSDPKTCVIKTGAHHGLHAESKSYITVCGIGVDGSRGADTSTTGNIAVFFHNCTYCTVERCRIWDVKGEGIGVGGVSAPGESSHMTARDNHIYQCNDNCIDLNAAQHCLLRGNLCRDGKKTGIFVGHGNTFHNIIAENICKDNGIDGIILDGSDYASEGATALLNTIADNVCYNNGRHGIQLLGAENNTVHGNQCNNNGQVTANSAGIVLTDDVEAQVSQLNLIYGNVCYDTSGSPTQDYGIWDAGSCQDNIYFGNRVAGNASAQISLTGTRSQSFLNSGYDQTTQTGLKLAKGAQTKISTADVSSPPTDAQLDSAFGEPATVGSGFVAVVDDNGAHSAEWIVWSDGANWWHAGGTKAV